jgi:CubicO group peptidase (beta-lactamase class C family)
MKLRNNFFNFVVILSILTNINQNILANNDQNESNHLAVPLASANESQQYVPESVGLNSLKLNQIELIVLEGIRAKAFPSCQVVVMRNGKNVYNKAFGTYTYESSQKINTETLFDLASVTKTSATLFAVMKLYDEGKLKLTDSASTYLEFLKNTDKQDIRIIDLLFHESGLPAYLPFYKSVVEAIPEGNNSENHPKPSVTTSSKTLQYKADLVSKTPDSVFSIQLGDSFYIHKSFHDTAMQTIAETKLLEKTFRYSCINFITLKEIVEKITGTSMDKFLDKEFYKPMNLTSICYLPLRNHSVDNIAPTLEKEELRSGVIQGWVNDPAAAFLGGISGNAGLFSTATDLAKLYQMLLNKGELDGKRYLSTATCELFSQTVSANSHRGLGFDKPRPQKPSANPCGVSAPIEVYGHTGYTGTCVWVDPVNDMVYVFLSNRTYPNDSSNKLSSMSIRPRIHEVIYQAMKK